MTRRRDSGVTVTMVMPTACRATRSSTASVNTVPAIEPGTYTVKATVQGYKTFERKAVPVSVQQFAGWTSRWKSARSKKRSLSPVSRPSSKRPTPRPAIYSIRGRSNRFRVPAAVSSSWRISRRPCRPAATRTGTACRSGRQLGVSMGGGAVRANNYLVDGFPVTDLRIARRRPDH